MTETDAVVVRLEGDYVWVRATAAGNPCGACARHDACPNVGQGSVLDAASAQRQATRLLRLPNTIQARPGDAVVLAVADGMIWRAVWRAYGVPLALAFAGALAGSVWLDSEWAALGGLLLGLAGGFGILHYRGLDFRRAEPILSIGFKRIP